MGNALENNTRVYPTTPVAPVFNRWDFNRWKTQVINLCHSLGIGSTSPATGVTPPALTGRQHLVLALVFLAALGVRGTHWWGQAQHNPFFNCPTMDEQRHHEWAQQIASGDGLDKKPFFRAPLYYYMLAGIYRLFGVNIALARFIGVILGAVTCYLIARLGAALGGWVVGLIAGLLAAVYWPLVHYDVQLLTVGLEVLLNVLLLWLLLGMVKSGRWWLFLAAGIIWGLSTLARPNILAFAPGIIIWIWLGRKLATRPWRPSLAAALVFVGAILVILPVTIRNRVVGGEWVLIASNGGVNFYIGNNEDADGITAIVPGTRPDWDGGYEDSHRIPEEELGRKLGEAEVSSYWFKKGLAWIGAHPGAWLKLMVLKFRLFWSPVEILNNQPPGFFARLSGNFIIFWIGFPIIACLGLAGLTSIRGDWRVWALPILYLVICMGSVILFFCNARYRLPIVPVLILLAAQGVVRLVQDVRARRKSVLGAYLAVGVLAVIFLATNPPARGEFSPHQTATGYHQLGQHYLRLSDDDPTQLEPALYNFEQAVQLSPEAWLIREGLGLCLEKLGRHEEARRQWLKTLQYKPVTPDGLLYQGGQLESEGQLEGALAKYRQAIELDPRQPEPYLRLGNALLRLGRTEEALEPLRRVHKLRPDLIDVEHELGVALAKQGRYAEAIQHFEAILADQPEHLSSRLNLGSALTMLGRYEPAAEQLRQVLAQEPTHLPAAESLIFVLKKLGRWQEVPAILQAALRRTPNNIGMINDLAWILATAPDDSVRDGARAVQLAERARQLSPRPNAAVLSTLAAAHAESGHFDQALALSQQVLEMAQAARHAVWIRATEERLKLYRQNQPYRESP